MAITFLVDTERAATSSNGATTNAIDTSGADLLIMFVTGYSGGPGSSVVSDSKGNTWNALTVQGSNGGSRLYWSKPTSVGSGHTFTSNEANKYSSVHVAAFAGTAASPFDQQNGANSTSAVEISTGSITPSEDNCLIVTGTGFFGTNATTTIEVETGYTQLGMIQQQFAVTVGGELAYKIQTTAAAQNPRWDWAATEAGSGVIASFKAAAAGSTYTLDAASATYSYTATAADLLHGYLIDAASATYNYTATAATLTRDMPLIPDSAAYTWTANDASLEYTPLSTYTLNADSAAYTWTATDAGLLHGYAVDADAASYLWTANDASLDYAPLSSQRLTYGAAPHTLDPARVRHKWEEIEEIDRRIAAKQEAEREKIRKQEEAKRQLADLEEKKRHTKTIAERKRKLEARIAAYQSEITELRQAVIALVEQIERIRAEQELQQTIADRRRRMVLLLAAAA